jgi:hypothetical protein
MGISLASSKDRLHGKWNLSFAFVTPTTVMPSITLQLVDLTASRTVSVAESQPRTIAASYRFACFRSFLRRAEVHMQRNQW